VCRAGTSRVIEVPTSAAFVGPGGPRLERLARSVPAVPGLRRWLRELGLRTLNAESEILADLRRVVDVLVARGVPLFHVSFHSSTLLAGATPFTRSERDVDVFVARLEGVLEHALGRHGAIPLGVSDVPAYFGGDLITPPAAMSMLGPSSGRRP
jgi:hypothetical protein